MSESLLVSAGAALGMRLTEVLPRSAKRTPSLGLVWYGGCEVATAPFIEGDLLEDLGYGGRRLCPWKPTSWPCGIGSTHLLLCCPSHTLSPELLPETGQQCLCRGLSESRWSPSWSARVVSHTVGTAEA